MPDTKKTTKEQDLDQCYLYQGVTYGPGENITVPIDFPDKPGDRPQTMANLGKHVGSEGVVLDPIGGQRGGKINPMSGTRPGTSGSGVSLEHAPGEGVVNETAAVNEKAGVAAEKAADKQMAENQKTANATTKEMKAAGTPVDKATEPGIGGAATISSKAQK